MAKEYLIMAF